jgi:hypothetical protein
LYRLQGRRWFLGPFRPPPVYFLKQHRQLRLRNAAESLLARVQMKPSCSSRLLTQYSLEI